MGGSLRSSVLFVYWLVGFSNLLAQVMITPADGLITGEAASILHKFPVVVQDFALEISPATSPQRWQLVATLPVAGITTGLGLRDRKMYRKIFLHGKLDTVRYMGQTVGNFVPGSHQVDGRLTINDQTHPQPLTVHIQVSADTLTLWGDMAISLQDYGIHIGIVKDTLHMEFHFTLPRSRLIDLE
ncbi:MAG: YceI family protein [Candidatus Marinimicrobia bacterium]|nr:YceI family protein [Candidatus Neomarinimicrobiota bacterium]